MVLLYCRPERKRKTKMNKSLLAALALLPVIAIGGEQVILKKDFDGFAMRKTRHVDGWSLLSYCPGELSREKGALMLKAISPQPEPATAKPVTGT